MYAGPKLGTQRPQLGRSMASPPPIAAMPTSFRNAHRGRRKADPTQQQPATSSRLERARKRTLGGRAFKRETLAAFLRALTGTEVVLRLRGDIRVRGVPEWVQDDLGVWMSPGTWSYEHLPAKVSRAGYPASLLANDASDVDPKRLCGTVFFSGLHLTAVEVPDVDVSATLLAHERRLETARSRHARGLRR